MDPEYLRYVRGWMEAVAREVIVPNKYPHGPILPCRCERGHLLGRRLRVDKFQLREHAAAHYPAFLETKYGSIEKYNAAAAHTAEASGDQAAGRVAGFDPRERPPCSIGRLRESFYRRILSTYVEYLREEGVSVPAVITSTAAGRPGSGRGHVIGRYNRPT